MFSYLNRVLFGTAIAAAIALTSVSARADWREKYKELNFGISSSENERDAVARYEPFAAYLTKKLGVPVHILWGTDYAAVIQAMNVGKIHFARIGAANYALGYKVMGDKIAPVGTDQNEDGSTGYYSVVVVRADSPYQKIEDLKGKVFAWADPNSGSAYAVPLYYLKKQGFEPSTYFAKTPFSGSHELSVLGVVNGTFDAAADDWYSETSSNVLRMEQKGMVGKGLMRTIWKSPGQIPNPPYVVRTDLPDEVKTLFQQALVAIAKEQPDVYRGLGLGRARGVVPTTHADYADTIAITLENNADRRKH